jgi:hypothetical protein
VPHFRGRPALRDGQRQAQGGLQAELLLRAFRSVWESPEQFQSPGEMGDRFLIGLPLRRRTDPAGPVRPPLEPHAGARRRRRWLPPPGPAPSPDVALLMHRPPPRGAVARRRADDGIQRPRSARRGAPTMALVGRGWPDRPAPQAACCTGQEHAAGGQHRRDSPGAEATTAVQPSSGAEDLGRHPLALRPGGGVVRRHAGQAG